MADGDMVFFFSLGGGGAAKNPSNGQWRVAADFVFSSPSHNESRGKIQIN